MDRSPLKTPQPGQIGKRRGEAEDRSEGKGDCGRNQQGEERKEDQRDEEARVGEGNCVPS